VAEGEAVRLRRAAPAPCRFLTIAVHHSAKSKDLPLSGLFLAAISQYK